MHLSVKNLEKVVTSFLDGHQTKKKKCLPRFQFINSCYNNQYNQKEFLKKEHDELSCIPKLDWLVTLSDPLLLFSLWFGGQWGHPILGRVHIPQPLRFMDYPLNLSMLSLLVKNSSFLVIWGLNFISKMLWRRKKLFSRIRILQKNSWEKSG